MCPVPKLAGRDEFNDIVSRLNDFVSAPPADDVSKMRVLKSIQARASSLRSTNEALGCAALGSVAAAMGNKKDALRLHEVSIQMLPHPDLYANYATSLMKLHELNLAYEVAEKSMSLVPNERALEVMLKVADLTGNEEMYEEHEANFHRLFRKQSEYDRNRQAVEDFELTLSCMVAAGESFADILGDPEEDEAWADL